MNNAFGIYVGNSRACLAIAKQDDSRSVVEVVANDAGDRVMPAIVTVTEGEVVVGAACKSLLVSRWNTTVVNNKRMIQEKVVPILQNGTRTVAMTLRGDDLYYELPLETGVEYMTPVEIATCIFQSLFEMAKSASGEENEIACVLLVPKDFTNETRQKLLVAAEEVGWDVMQIMNEPAAAVLGYNLFGDKIAPPDQTVLMYRVGGHSCNVTVMDISHGMVSVLDSEYSDEIGGKVLISALTKYLADEYYRKYKLNPRESHRSLTKLTLAAEECLQVLSTIESANCFVESLCDGVDLSQTVSRARFESLLFPFLPKFASPINKVLSRLNFMPEDMSKVLLVGGPLKIPRLKKYITDMFQDSHTHVVPLPNSINYDEVLAYGAAQQANCIGFRRLTDRYLPGEIEIRVLEFPINVQVEGAECEVVEFTSNLPLPAHKTVTLSSPSNQVTVTFTQFESNQVTLRGQIQLDNLEDPTELQLEIDSENGINVGTLLSSGLVQHKVKLYAHFLNDQEPHVL